jgi:chromatin remodeling complex protein RSC6
MEAAPVVETQPATEVVDTPISTVFAEFSSLMTELQSARAHMSALCTKCRVIERQVTRELKNAAKISQKRKRKEGTRAPSGFVKPALISNELAAFLGEPEGSEMARTKVTSAIHTYAKANNLQNPKNGRILHPDKKLAKLLKIDPDVELTYFNLQKYMACHFAKASDKITNTATA